MKLEKTAGNNVILMNEKVKVSYNPDTGAGMLGGVSQAIGGITGNKEGEETALIGKDGLWRILEGDFRKEYEKVYPNWKKCLAVYNKHKEESRSGWSTDEEVK